MGEVAKKVGGKACDYFVWLQTQYFLYFSVDSTSMGMLKTYLFYRTLLEVISHNNFNFGFSSLITLSDNTNSISTEQPLPGVE